MKRDSLRAVVVALAMLITSHAAIGSDESLLVELNKLEPNEGDCRAYLVLENGSASAFESLKLDVVVFDTDGIVAKRLAVEAAPLPLGKTSLKVFDIGGLPCDQVGRVLLNEVMTCADASQARGDCLALMSTSSRAPIPFIK